MDGDLSYFIECTSWYHNVGLTLYSLCRSDPIGHDEAETKISTFLSVVPKASKVLINLTSCKHLNDRCLRWKLKSLGLVTPWVKGYWLCQSESRFATDFSDPSRNSLVEKFVDLL